MNRYKYLYTRIILEHFKYLSDYCATFDYYQPFDLKPLPCVNQVLPFST